MPGEDLGEKTEEATPKRRADAREEGNVAKSQDLSAAILLTTAVLGLAILITDMLGQGTRMTGAMLDLAAIVDPLDPGGSMALLAWITNVALRIVAPIMLILWLAGYISHFVQIGYLFAPKGVAPKIEKLDPIKGFQRIFSLTSLVKVSLDSLKVTAAVIVASLTMAEYHDQMLVLPYLDMLPALKEVGKMLLVMALRLLALLLILGIVDFTWQKVKFSKDLRMTKQQVKDEMKQSEGDPETKRRRMQVQQQLAAQRVNAAVPRADVIVTNPEHLSVAIQYDPDTMAAPVVVAKGADFLALRIRQIARKHNIPIVERKPLARALYKEVQVGQPVPPETYKAVAEILAYVYRLNERMAG